MGVFVFGEYFNGNSVQGGHQRKKLQKAENSIISLLLIATNVSCNFPFFFRRQFGTKCF